MLEDIVLPELHFVKLTKTTQYIPLFLLFLSILLSILLSLLILLLLFLLLRLFLHRPSTLAISWDFSSTNLARSQSRAVFMPRYPSSIPPQTRWPRTVPYAHSD